MKIIPLQDIGPGLADPAQPPNIALVRAGEKLVALPRGALWWPRGAMLFVADLHLGRAAARRASGLASPEGSDAADLAALGNLLDQTRALTLAILGDLLHAPMGLTEAVRERLTEFLDHPRCQRVILVEGNHDRCARHWLAGLERLECHAGPVLAGPFQLVHEPHVPVRRPQVQIFNDAAPRDKETPYTLAGHLHPGVSMRDDAGCRFRQKCFHFGASLGVLPAFGRTTAAGSIRAAPGDLVYAVDEQRVVDVSAACRLTRRARGHSRH